jgi:hypothetical protein
MRNEMAVSEMAAGSGDRNQQAPGAASATVRALTAGIATRYQEERGDRTEPPFDLRAKCRELGCRPRNASDPG